MNSFEFKRAFDEGQVLINDKLKAKIKKGAFLSIWAEMKISVNVVKIITNDVVEIGPTDKFMAASLAAYNWTIGDDYDF